jgi:hypothetical protein
MILTFLLRAVPALPIPADFLFVFIFLFRVFYLLKTGGIFVPMVPANGKPTNCNVSRMIVKSSLTVAA